MNRRKRTGWSVVITIAMLINGDRLSDEFVREWRRADGYIKRNKNNPNG